MYIDGVDKWEKSTETNLVRKTTSVFKAENGFVVHISSYAKPQPNEKGVCCESSSEKCKLYISKTNPLEGLDKVEEKFKINTNLPAKEGEIIIED